jgi:hypothetical protein
MAAILKADPQMTQINADENRAASICEHLRHLRI